MPRFKAAVRTARCASRQLVSPVPPVSRPPRVHRRRPDSSPRPPPDRSPRSRRHPDRRGPKLSTSGSVAASRRSLVAVTPRRRLRAGEPPFPAVSRAPALGRTRGPRPHCASGPSAVSAQWHPVKFYYFLIYSFQCKFKNLCRIHLISENYETNFVGKD
jgi:hypothetical protein